MAFKYLFRGYNLGSSKGLIHLLRLNRTIPGKGVKVEWQKRSLTRLGDCFHRACIKQYDLLILIIPFRVSLPQLLSFLWKSTFP